MRRIDMSDNIISKDELKEAVEGMGKAFDAFKETNDKKIAEIESKGHADPLTTDKLARIEATLDKYEELNQKATKNFYEQQEVADKVKKLETAMKRPDSGLTTEDIDAKGNAFEKLLRKGKSNLDEMELKVLTVSNDTTGGYLAPPEYVREIIKKVTEYSPIRTIARVRATTNRSVQIPSRTGVFAASWTSEVGTRAETTGLTFGLEEIAAHEMYALVDISEQDVEDPVFDMQSVLAEEFAEQFAVAEGTAFVNGTAAGQPEGYMVNATVGETNTGEGAILSINGLLNLYGAVKSDYARNGTFVFNRSTLSSIRQLNTGTGGSYVFQAGFSLQTGVPNTILGQPYVEASAMPNVGAGAFPIVFGDMRRAYTIVDRISLSILRDPYTQANTGSIRYIARKRVGGQVVLAEAIRKQKVSA
jgi:HK97 family phage major capsid protein|tara:strand:+ start:2221 stop:3474 length:1254 start_codon:yes stop_codon:yes gene_type:complete